MSTGPILSEDLSQWLPAKVVLASSDQGWQGVKLRGYRSRAVDVELPPLDDFMILAVRRGHARIQRRTSGEWLDETVTPGDVSLLTRDTQSHWKTDHGVEVIHVYLDLPIVTRICEEVFEREVSEVCLQDVLRTRDPVLFQGALAIADEVAWGEPGSALYVDAIVQQMCIQILRRYSTVSFRAVTDCKGLSASQGRRITEYIEANLERQLTLDDLATVVHLGRYHFLRQFKLRFGTTPHAYVIKRRLKRARTLLAKSSLSIEEIAARVGFSDQSHLTRSFRRYFETTPLRYRMAARG